MSKVKELNIKNFVTVDLQDAKEKLAGKDKLRPLLVDLEFSASGKVINRRIYPPAGHKAGLDSWLKPYPKPVLVHHDSSKDPIGRVHSIRWEDTEDKALAFLGGDLGALAEIKRAFATNDAKVISKTLKRYNALSDKWPGLGRLVGKVKIVDLEAVQKFLDERYLTFSAGQSTDQWVCMSCGNDWQAGAICDHRPGEKDEDGNTVLFLCGNMHGKEISVEHEPANDTSVVLNMEFQDNDGNDAQIVLNLTDATEPVTKLEVNFELESDMNLNDLAILEIKTVIELLSDDAKLQEFKDALSGDSAFEVSWLIKMHDALHSQYDYELKWRDPKDLSVPVGVFKLHGLLHDLAMEKNFRDAVSNGQLDFYGPDGTKSEEYLIKMPSEQTEDKFDEDSLVSKIVDRLKSEVIGAKEEEKDEVEVLDEECPSVEDEDIDWVLMDLALDTEVGDAKLSTEKRNDLPKGSFCGPDRSFPVPDCAHVTAARRLVGRAKLTADQKAKVLACVNKKAKSLGCDSEDSSATPAIKDCECKDYDKVVADHNNLKNDYTKALQDIEQLTAHLNAFGKALAQKVEPSKNIDGIKLDELLDWFSNIVVSDNTIESKEEEVLEHPAKELKPLDDSKPQKKSLDTLGGYEKRVVSFYRRIQQDESAAIADRYLAQCRQYLPDNFNPEDYE